MQQPVRLKPRRGLNHAENISQIPFAAVSYHMLHSHSCGSHPLNPVHMTESPKRKRLPNIASPSGMSEGGIHQPQSIRASPRIRSQQKGHDPFQLPRIVPWTARKLVRVSSFGGDFPFSDSFLCFWPVRGVRKNRGRAICCNCAKDCANGPDVSKS